MNPRLRPDSGILLLLVPALVAAFVLTCSSCKSLEKRCAQAFPPELHTRTMFISSGTDLPGSKLNVTSPCDELLRKLPDSGEPVILDEDDNGQLQARKDSAGNLAFNALIKPRHVPNTHTVTERESTQRLCDCTEKIKAAKWALITDSLTIIAISTLALLFAFFYLRHRRNAPA